MPEHMMTIEHACGCLEHMRVTLQLVSGSRCVAHHAPDAKLAAVEAERGTLRTLIEKAFVELNDRDLPDNHPLREELEAALEPME
jgi:hypothetical protein